MHRYLIMFFCIAFSSTSFAQIQQLLPPAELARIRNALPHVEGLDSLLRDSQTLWYNESVMADSYQDSVGASSNKKWPDLVAGSEDTIAGLHDRSNHRWQFPFATTATADASSNLQVENFASFPEENGRIKTVIISREDRNAGRPQWTWEYWPGTVFGELMFIKDGANILPIEVRTRTKTATGWTMNAFRPFPTADDLWIAIQWRRYGSQDPNILRMLAFLKDNTTLKPASLKAANALAPLFQQEGYLDVLPEFGDDALVRDLLTSTPFTSAFGAIWKQNGAQKAYAATASGNSISVVPNNYNAGLLEVNDESCTRCHKDGGRLVSEFYPALYLYGEVWGKDGIFSFHPYDESLYPRLRQSGSDVDGYFDNRRLNPKLKEMGIFDTDF